MRIVIETEVEGLTENEAPGRLSAVGKVISPIEMNGYRVWIDLVRVTYRYEDGGDVYQAAHNPTHDSKLNDIADLNGSGALAMTKIPGFGGYYVLAITPMNDDDLC